MTNFGFHMMQDRHLKVKTLDIMSCPTHGDNMQRDHKIGIIPDKEVTSHQPVMISCDFRPMKITYNTLLGYV